MIEIIDHPRKNVRCDIAGCKHLVEPLWIYEQGAPMALRHILCKSHLKEIVEVGSAFLGMEMPDKQLESDLVSQLEAKDALIEELHRQLEALDRIEPEQPKPESISPETMDRPDLIRMAKTLGIKGKIVTMDNKELARKIKEAQAI